MNYMEQIAKMLGLELGEYFKISGMDDTFWLDDDGLCMQDNKGDYDLNALMMALLTGRSKVVYPPWKLKIGDAYYYNSADGKTWSETFDGDSVFDLMIVKFGKAYRTEEEAKARAEEDAAFWNSIREELMG